MGDLRYQLFGPTGLRVSELCLGTMTFNPAEGKGTSPEVAHRMMDAFAEKGGNFLDTADMYTGGNSEKIIGDYLQERGERDRWVVATKYTFSRRDGDPNAGGNHRKNMVHAVEASLRRLQTDAIDLLWVHRWDDCTPLDELMAGLQHLVSSGKVLYVGASDFPAWVVSRANMLAELRGWAPFVGLQIEYSLLERTVERDLTPMARALGLTVTPWSPLAGGVLSGKYELGTAEENARFKQNEDSPFYKQGEHAAKVVQAVLDVAKETGRPATQVALNWLRAKERTLPIFGARTLEQFEDNLACTEWSLTPEQVQRLDQVSEVDIGFPRSFLESDMTTNFLHSGLRDRLDYTPRI